MKHNLTSQQMANRIQLEMEHPAYLGRTKNELVPRPAGMRLKPPKAVNRTVFNGVLCNH